MLRRIVVRSLFNRKTHLMVATVAMLLATTLVASLITLSLGTESQASRELEAYGANMIVLPESVSLPAGTGGLAFGKVTAQDYIADQNLRPLAAGQIDAVSNYVPYLYAVADYQGQKVVVAGTLFDKLKELGSYWQIEGRWVTDEKEKGSIIGMKVAQRFTLHPGDEFLLNFGEVSQNFKVSGIADVGGSEDSQVFIDLKTAQVLSGRTGQIDLVQIRAATEKWSLPEIADELERKLPGVEAKVISQVAKAEEIVLFKVQLLMVLMTALVLLASGIAVFSTLTNSVLERTKEIGLMKALGATDGWISLIFLTEAWAIGLVGGLLGNIFGLGMAQAIAKSVFDSYLSPQILATPISLAIALAIATVAALGPVRHALSLEPIVTLRGE